MDKRKISRSGRPEDWAWLDSLVNKLDEDFIQAANEQPEQQERPALDRLFKQFMRWYEPASGLAGALGPGRDSCGLGQRMSDLIACRDDLGRVVEQTSEFVAGRHTASRS